MRLLTLAPLAACSGKVPRPPVVPHAVEAWLAHIPAPCLDETPIVAIVCPPLPAEPADACIVEQRDLETDTLVDRFVFAGARLVRHDMTVSDQQNITILLDYDDQGRLLRETKCMTLGGGEPSWSPSWREVMVRYDSPTSSVDRTERTYATSLSRVPAFADIVSTWRFEGKVVTTDMKLCYAFDRRGRRTERFQVYRMDDRPRALDTVLRTYAYGRFDVASIIYATLNLDRREAEPTFNVRFRSAWMARFTYNALGLVESIETAGSSPMTYRYDERGRLVNYGSVVLAWDDAGRLVSVDPGRGLAREYRYDAQGRLEEAGFGSDRGYRVAYSATCEQGFVPPAMTPNADAYLYFEGKDTL